MKQLQFGNTDLRVPPLSFGGNVFGWTLDEKASFRMLDQLHDCGLVFVDTANNYSRWAPGNRGGESETIIGKWFKESGKRHDMVLSTKVGGLMGDGSKGLRAGYIRSCVEDSLRRLQTEYIDLYLSHYDDLDTPQEETMHTFHTLVQEGKVRYIGASNLEPERIRSANSIAAEKGWVRYSAIQPLYNLYDREKFETDYEPLVQEEAMAVMSYFALASGFLSGKYRSEADLAESKRKDMVKGYLDARGLRILDQLQEMASDKDVSMATLAIAWQLHKPDITTPIVSATSKEQLQTLVAATELTLSPEEMQRLDTSSAWK